MTFAIEVGGTRGAIPIDRTEARDPGAVLWLGPPAPSLFGEGELLVAVDGRPARRWPVAWRPRPEDLPAFQEPVQLGLTGRHAEARRMLESLSADPDPFVRHYAAVERARSLQRLGQGEASIAAWRLAADGARANRWTAEACRLLRAASYVALTGADLVESERLLDEADALPADEVGPWERARLDLHRGYVVERLGDHARAVSLYRSVLAASHETGADGDHATAVTALATLVVKLGDVAEARRLLEATVPFYEARRSLARTYAPWLVNRAWVRMGGGSDDATPSDLEAARALYLEAQALFRALGEPERVAFCDVRLAWIEQQLGRSELARTHVAEARRLAPDGVDLQEGWLVLLEGHLEEAAGRSGPARERFETTVRLAEEAGPERDLVWRGLHGLGRVAVATGDRAAARGAFTRALAVLEDVGRRTSLAESRGPFFAARRALVDDAIGLLVAEGAIDDAFSAADALQAQVARALETQARIATLAPEARRRHAGRVGDWLRERALFERDARGDRRLAGEALVAWRARRSESRAKLAARFDAIQSLLDAEAPPAAPEATTVAGVQAALEPDSALILFVRLRGRPHGFWVDPGRADLSASAAEDLAAPWRDRLAGLSRLYVVPGDVPGAQRFDRLTEVPVGFLPYAGLLARRGKIEGTGALVVADPLSDLPHARREGADVAGRLPDARHLVGRAATREAILAALPGVRTFHFAGHGALDATGPWDAHLALADGARLTFRDVVTLSLRADLVVLSGCETADRAELGAEHLGLPDAFVLAGARTVVAAEGKVDDNAVAAFMTRFHEAAAVASPGRALRTAGAGLAVGRAFRIVGRP